MGESTGIEWTDATVNFWWGCTEVGPGCDNCYAKAWDKRTGGAHFGKGQPRRKIKGAVKLMHRLDNDYSWWAADLVIGAGEKFRPRNVFVQSMSDLFDNEVPIEWFSEAWETVAACDRLAIQVVTKRLPMIEKRLREIGAILWPQHVGLMASVCNQAEANRDVPRLLALKEKLGIPWVGLSMEPLLGPVDLDAIETDDGGIYALLGIYSDGSGPSGFREGAKLDWVIIGGESGPGARPMADEWAQDIINQCKAAGVAVYMKQMGGARKPFRPIPSSMMMREFPVP